MLKDLCVSLFRNPRLDLPRAAPPRSLLALSARRAWFAPSRATVRSPRSPPFALLPRAHSQEVGQKSDQRYHSDRCRPDDGACTVVRLFHPPCAVLRSLTARSFHIRRYLQDNKISGIIPDVFGQLTNLAGLCVSRLLPKRLLPSASSSCCAAPKLACARSGRRVLFAPFTRIVHTLSPCSPSSRTLGW